MSPVDAIRPPDREQRKPQTTTEPQPTPKKTAVTLEKKSHHAKERMIWIIAGSITVLILIGWLILYLGGNLTNESGNTFFSQLGDQISDVWETIKTDILKIQSAINTTEEPIAEEQIRQLEEQVFPQFTDPENQ